MKTVANRIDLGMTRIAGYTLYDESSKEFQETTVNETKKLVCLNEVNGLRMINDEIELDAEGFNIQNLMVKSAVGKYRPLYNTDTIVNCMYAVTKVTKTGNGEVYEIINNRSARKEVTSSRLKLLMEIAYVAGVRERINGEIEVCKGVTVEDRRTGNPTEYLKQSVLSGLSADPISLNTDNLQVEQKASDSTISNVKDTPIEKADSLECIFSSVAITEGKKDIPTDSDKPVKKVEEILPPTHERKKKITK